MHLLGLQLAAEGNLAAADMEELPECHREWAGPVVGMAAGHMAQAELGHRHRAEAEGIAQEEVRLLDTDSPGTGRGVVAAAQAERRSPGMGVADTEAVPELELVSPPGAADNTAGLLAVPGARRNRDIVRQVGRLAVVARRSMAAETS